MADVLPDDCLVHIFRWLPVEDLVFAARHVCRRWRSVSEDPALWRSRELDLSLPQLRLHRQMLLVAPCLRALRLPDRLGACGLAGFLSTAPSDIRRLDASCPCRSEATSARCLLALLSRCRPHLESLRLRIPRREFQFQPHPFEDVDIQDVWDAVDLAKLQEITIPSCFLSCSTEDFGNANLRSIIIDPKDEGGYTTVAPETECYETLSELISAHAPVLKELFLPLMVPGAGALAVYAAVQRCQRLESLRMAVTGAGAGLLEQLQQLTELHISLSDWDTPADLRRLADGLRRSSVGLGSRLSVLGLQRDRGIFVSLTLTDSHELLGALHNLSAIKSLQLNKVAVPGSLLDRLESLETLILIDLMGRDVSQMTHRCSKWVSIKEIRLADCRCSKRGPCLTRLAAGLKASRPALKLTGFGCYGDCSPPSSDGEYDRYDYDFKKFCQESLRSNHLMDDDDWRDYYAYSDYADW